MMLDRLGWSIAPSTVVLGWRPCGAGGPIPGLGVGASGEVADGPQAMVTPAVRVLAGDCVLEKVSHLPAGVGLLANEGGQDFQGLPREFQGLTSVGLGFRYLGRDLGFGSVHGLCLWLAGYRQPAVADAVKQAVRFEPFVGLGVSRVRLHDLDQGIDDDLAVTGDLAVV